MATIRFYGEFKDDKGDTWRVNLHDTGYDGTAYENKLGADGFTLSYSGDSENRYQGIIGSSVQFIMFNTESIFDTFLNDILPASAEGRMQVEVRFDPDGVDTLFWCGILAAEQVEQEDMPQPNAVTFVATDDIGNLTNKRFVSTTTGLTDVIPCVDVILNILNQTRTTNFFATDAPFFRYVNDIVSSGYTGTDWLDEVLVDPPLTNDNTPFVEEQRGYDSFRILESICISLNCRLFQSQGYWWFWPNNAYLRASQGETITSSVKQQTKASVPVPLTTGQSAEIDDLYITEVDSTFTKLSGAIITHLPPLKRVHRKRRHDGNQYLYDLYTTGITTGDNLTFSDTDRTYLEGIKFQTSGSVQIQLDGQTANVNPYNLCEVQVQTSLKVGNRYWGNNGWTGTPTENVQTVATFQISDGLNTAVTYGFETDNLPTTELGVDVTIQIRIIKPPGTDITANYTGDELILISHLLLTGDDGLLGDYVIYTSSTTVNNLVEIDQGEVLHGDPQGQIEGSVGQTNYGVFGLAGYPYTYTSSQTTTPTPLHRLGVTEILASGQYPIRVRKGGFFGRVFHMWQTIKEGAEYYAPFESSVTMNNRQTQIQRWLLDYNVTGVSALAEPAANDEDTVEMIFASNLDNSGGDLGLVMRQMQGGELPEFNTVTAVRNVAMATYDILGSESQIFNFWTGANGMSRIFLPSVTGNEGRVIGFHSDATITANTYVSLFPFATDTGVTIDGAASYNFNRAYDGITILCHGGQWYIIQKKDK